MISIDRMLPEKLKTLARLALAANFAKVSLDFEALGAEFPAPIGWQLSLQPHPITTGSQDYLTVSAQIGSAPDAYIGLDSVFAPFGSPDAEFLDVTQITT